MYVADNDLYFNAGSGIKLDGSQHADWYIIDNHFQCNDNKAVELLGGANGSLYSPTVNIANQQLLAGTAEPNAQIEIWHKNAACPTMGYQTKDKVTVVTADAFGEWNLLGPFTPGDVILVQQHLSTAYFSSSAFSACTEISACPISFNFTNSLSGVFDFEASDHIKATNTIRSGADVTYDAANYIQLDPGFSTELGAIFQTVIDGCGNVLNVPEEEK